MLLSDILAQMSLQTETVRKIAPKRDIQHFPQSTSGSTVRIWRPPPYGELGVRTYNGNLDLGPGVQGQNPWSGEVP